MRLSALPLTMAVCFGLIGCSSTMTLPPVQPEEVDVFLPGTLPSEEYKVMTRFSIRRGLNDPDQLLIDDARARAAEVGADAIVITDIRRTTEGGLDFNLSQEQEKILDALAVYYPSRHPELEDG